MKKLLLLPLVLLTTMSFAQLELGAGVGLGTFTSSKHYNRTGGYDSLGNSDRWYENSTKPKCTTVDISASYKINKSMRFGLGFESSVLSHKMSDKDTSVQFYSNVGGDSVFKTYINNSAGTYFIAAPLKTIYAFATYSKTIGRSELYGGGGVGYSFYKQKAMTSGTTVRTISGNTTIDDQTGYRYYEGEGSGIAIKLIAGYTYQLYKGLCLNAQICADYISVKNKSGFAYVAKVTENETLLVIPVTVGLHYKFSFTKKTAK